MRVLFLASEVVPFAKTGGLADVAGALPRALRELGVDVSVMLPAYRQAFSSGQAIEPTGLTVRVPVGPRDVDARVLASSLPGTDVPVCLIDRPASFDREGLYGLHGEDHPDNCERFVIFQRAALEAARTLGLRPDVVHCNDWQTGLVPVYIEEVERRRPGGKLRGAASLMTVHNLAYQGSFWHWDMPLTGLDWSLFTMDRLEAYGRLNFLKAGLSYADLLSTVSPTYALEIRTPEYGRGLDGLFRARAGDLYGVVNGIDPTVWNPAIDPLIARRYTIENWPERKPECKAMLQRRAGLPERPDVPVLAAIGRLDPQKGWDLILAVADELLRRDVQFVVLGSGGRRYEQALDLLAARHPGKVRVFLEFSDPLAHQIEAGADLFLMPSLYEPCGLNQLYSFAYGTVPVVRATGGLADTVVDASSSALRDGTATGFAFHDPTPEALLGAIGRALSLWPDRDAWSRLVRAGMSADWTWRRSASRYLELYDEACRRRAGRAAG